MTAPIMRIVSGDPTPEEIAALVAVLAGRPALVAPQQRPESAWWRSGQPAVGARHWRDTALPR